MDVELAVDLVALGIEDAYDVAVLASADTVALALVINDALRAGFHLGASAADNPTCCRRGASVAGE